jgi:flagellar motor switch/type III secretory pathway protein FliN
MPAPGPASKPGRVTDLEVSLTVVLAEKSFPLEEILELRPGAVLDLSRRPEAALGLRLSGSPIGRGRAIDIGERLGFLVEEIDTGGSPRNVGEPL